MQLTLVFAVVCASAAAAPDAAAPLPLRLRHPLPAMEQWAAKGDESVNEYHIRVGVPEAARIAAAEAVPRGEAVPQADERPELLIVGGLASYRGEHKFMAGLLVSLTTGETSVCGGSLVSPTRVLTAALCYWDGVSQASSMLVVLGSVALFSGGTREYASYITVHSGWYPASIYDNIALLQISYQYTTEYVKPIAMASGSEQYAGHTAEVIGYGRTADGAPITSAASQRDVFVGVLSNAACQAAYGGAITASELCTSGAAGRNPCGGDQGGPLILYSSAGNDLLLGVFAFGSTAGCQAGAPAGYMRLSYYYSWVLSNL